MNVTREEFIKIIVDKVLANLAENKEFLQKDISDENGIWKFDQTLFTFSDAQNVKSKHCNKVIFSPKTIITPLAHDFLIGENIHIEKLTVSSNLMHEAISAETSKKIAILCNENDIVYKNKTKEILLKLGIECEWKNPKNNYFYEFENCLLDLAKKTESGKYHSAIIINNEAFKLRKILQNNNSLNGQICWEINSSKVCNIKSKYLFINSALLGFNMLESKIDSWIKLNQN